MYMFQSFGPLSTDPVVECSLLLLLGTEHWIPGEGGYGFVSQQTIVFILATKHAFFLLSANEQTFLFYPGKKQTISFTVPAGSLALDCSLNLQYLYV